MAVKIRYRIKFSAEALDVSDVTQTISVREEVEGEIERMQSMFAKSILQNWVTSQKSSQDEMQTRGDVEKMILRQLVKIYAAKVAADVTKYRIAADLVDMLKHAEQEIILEKEDIDAIKSGFKESLKTGRPDGWIEYADLIRQLDNPEAVEEK